MLFALVKLHKTKSEKILFESSFSLVFKIMIWMTLNLKGTPLLSNMQHYLRFEKWEQVSIAQLVSMLICTTQSQVGTF